MHKEFLMGNEAIALGAMAAGVGVVSGYPGTPSTEVLEAVAKNNSGSTYVEWSVNEKSGMEVAAAAAYAGTRSMVTMKQVGLNVASDPLMIRVRYRHRQSRIREPLVCFQSFRYLIRRR